MRVLAVLLLAFLVTGCGAEKSVPVYRGSDITGADFGHRLALVDHNGRAVTLESFKGKLVVLFFGYTHCPDVCPTTMSDMAQAIKLMRPEDGARVQVLFVSVDPERDTPEILKAYVPYFHASFLGLHGTPEQVAEVAKEFKIFYRKHVEPGATGYLVDHSAGSYVLDPQGKIRLYLPFAHPAADIASDLGQLLAAG